MNNNKLSQDIRTTAEELKTFMENTDDLVLKYGRAGGHNICVITCENMTSADTVANMVYRPLNALNKETFELEEFSSLIQDGLLIAVEQSTVSTYEELSSYIMSGYAVLLVEGLCYGFAMGAQGFKTRSVEESKTQRNLRSSREAFNEVLKTGVTLLRRRIKSPKMVFKFMTLGDRSNTGICLCYLSDKADKNLIDAISKRLKAIKLSDILESGYIQPFLEDKGNVLFSEVGVTERPDTLAAKLYEGRVGIMVDGTPFAIYIPHLFIENFQTVDDYTGNVLFMGFVRVLKYLAFIFTVLLPGYYVAIANFHPQLFPSNLLFSLSRSISTTPFPLLVECIIIHLVYEVMREAGIRLPVYVGHTIAIVGGLVIGEIAVSAGLVSAPIALIAAMGAIAGFIVPDLYDSIIVLRFGFMLAGGLWGLYGISLLILALLFKVCSMANYGIPYTAPITPFTLKAMKDTFAHLRWSGDSDRDTKVQDLKGVTLVDS